MIDKAKLAVLRDAIAELDDLEAPTLESIVRIESQMRALSAQRDLCYRRIAELGDAWADRLDVTLPGWRALLSHTPVPVAYGDEEVSK